MSTLTKEETEQVCACCQKLKLCHLYVLQHGYAEFVCKSCREGKKS